MISVCLIHRWVRPWLSCSRGAPFVTSDRVEGRMAFLCEFGGAVVLGFVLMERYDEVLGQLSMLKGLGRDSPFTRILWSRPANRCLRLSGVMAHRLLPQRPLSYRAVPARCLHYVGS